MKDKTESTSTDKSCGNCEGLGYFEISGVTSIDIENICTYCNGTGIEPQETSEEIRNAFQKVYESLWRTENICGNFHVELFKAGYKAHEAKAKAEIEELKGKYKKKLYLSINLESRIKELKQQIEDLQCCNTCQDLVETISDGCECIKDGSGDKDNWKPRSKE